MRSQPMPILSASPNITRLLLLAKFVEIRLSSWQLFVRGCCCFVRFCLSFQFEEIRQRQLTVC